MMTPALLIDPHEGGITEIILPEATDGNSEALVMPMLAYLSRKSQSKWFTWIVPSKVSKLQMKNFGFDNEKTRLIYTKHKCNNLDVFSNALKNGNSSTVVANVDRLTDSQYKALENASQIGRTRGIILRYR